MQNEQLDSMKTLELVKMRKEKMGIASQEYADLKREVQGRCRRDKEADLQRLCSNLEADASRGENQDGL